MAAIEGAQFVLESDWVVGLLGVLVSLFSALAWFVKQTVANGVKGLETRMSRDLSELNGHLKDISSRVGRLERQMDETIIPRQERISRQLDTEDDE